MLLTRKSLHVLADLAEKVPAVVLASETPAVCLFVHLCLEVLAPLDFCLVPPFLFLE